MLRYTQVAPLSSPPRWPDGATIRVWIDPKHAPPGAAILVDRALRAWTDAAERHFSLERMSYADAAAIRVRFGGDAVYGEARPRLDPATGAIVAAEMHINGEIAGTGDALLERIIIYLTALHELGYALGLPHTDNFSAIMYSFRQPDVESAISVRIADICDRPTRWARPKQAVWRPPIWTRYAGCIPAERDARPISRRLSSAGSRLL